MRTLVAIPVYNEEHTLAQVLKRARPYAKNILAVDDGSTDRTWEILRQESDVSMIRHATNLGYGRTLIDAFEYAIEKNYDVVITLDADNQHEPEYIPAFLSALPGADVVSGTRYADGFEDASDTPSDRLAINREITAVINRHTGYRLTDAFCGYKAYRVESLAKLNLHEPGYGMCLEFWIKAAGAGLSAREIPVRRIYADPNRTFGGHLDEAEKRRLYYFSVIADAVAVVSGRGRPMTCSVCGLCPTR